VVEGTEGQGLEIVEQGKDVAIPALARKLKKFINLLASKAGISEVGEGRRWTRG